MIVPTSMARPGRSRFMWLALLAVLVLTALFVPAHSTRVERAVKRGLGAHRRFAEQIN
jgi:hypothetical protein